jgi:nicotinate-nucleotide adenylyltransferase
MVELACAGEPRFEPAPLENGPRQSYSIHTISAVRATLPPGSRLFFVIGADAFAEINSWFRASDVVAAVEFIVVSRPGYRYPIPPGASVHRLETLALPVSSSDIRRRVQAGELPAELPPAVLQYVQMHDLYRR